MNLDDRVRHVLDERHRRRGRYQVIKLPCGHGAIQIPYKQDKLIICPTCAKQFVLTWAGKPKLRWEQHA